jgi:hypothetical protein
MDIVAKAMAKVTSKNQLTIPDRIMALVGRPSHFRIFASDRGEVLLVPARLRTMEEMAKDSGIPGDVLRQAYALVEADKVQIAAERKARQRS